MVTVRAPGKVILYGEHAVVYGEPALAMAVNKYIYVTAKARDDNKVSINARDLRLAGISVTIHENGDIVARTDYGAVISALSYVKRAVELAMEYFNKKVGIDLMIRSEMPVGAGLGTSAAVAVATILAYVKELGYDVDKRELARLAWQVERDVQGSASPTDTTMATFGGIMYIKPEGNSTAMEPVKPGVTIPLIIGYTPRVSTTKDLVAMVRRKYESMRDVIEPIIRSIGVITRKGREALEKGDLELMGVLMNINHGLLDALGVSTKQLNEMVYVARYAGALGSKLTGAGGGGCMIALTNKSEVEKAIELTGGSVLKAGLDTDGTVVISND
ncbi:mevalonate kinase [Vulcanisaeta souniana]|uniref:Mevalonate kinase n=1 Tax=Vulcanisaeta souniana JCM 11219 TaxID=1293586 RepID=A0A830E3B9_9CREN|nr:mevalonate kinase [Vulcanisaeta souniana]BDR93154.1 mevalonate kinase [Vulcanisaeta souniana JCM 11219]GGI78052.1 mevalonate kinase [Vulcanisaeta souniana JCM 11219]